MEKISLSKLYKKSKSDRDIFEELMRFKVKEILLVSSLYSAYSIEKDGQFSEKIFGEYLQLNLYEAPRITSVNNEIEAGQLISRLHFDLIIIIASLTKQDTFNTIRKTQKQKPNIPILLLVNNENELKFYSVLRDHLKMIDNIFMWNGDTKIFTAMVKYIEDKKNVANDIKVGNVRVILLVEDSVQYYSKYLPLLYSSVMTQTQRILTDESATELHKILKMRVRPKILLVSNYEHAIENINKYKNNLLCVISDAKYSRDFKLNDNAGIDLINYVNSKVSIATLLQSSDSYYRSIALKMGAEFINKNSESLTYELNEFIYHKLSFGDFIFRNKKGEEINTASTLQEFEEKLKTIPDESLLFHSHQNEISNWLIARGELNIAKKIRPYHLEDFSDIKELRKFCLDTFKKTRENKLRGNIVVFNYEFAKSEHHIVRLGLGSLGGKGRGLSFLCNFIENINFSEIIPDFSIKIPSTAIIGITEFNIFLEENDLYKKIHNGNTYNEIKESFLKAKISEKLKVKLYGYLKIVKTPLAIRSSGLYEDSMKEPFSGVYSTYFLPNNDKDIEVRLDQLITAVQLVYSSVYTDEAKLYFETINYKVEEEKMAVIIQEVIGKNYNNRYYPNISGVVQSYNYYPFSYIKAEDGFAVMAVGLGTYVAGGEKAYRFSPAYPKLSLGGTPDTMTNSQKQFYAINLEKKKIDLIKEGELSVLERYNINCAEEDGNLTNCASVYDYQNDMIVQDLSKKGPRIIDFANILKYEKYSLSKTLKILLELLKEAMGAPVEIEFAVNFNNGLNVHPTLYLLQIKPLIRSYENVQINLGSINKSTIIITAYEGMGNGRITDIQDIIYVRPDRFDKTQTNNIANEIAQLNNLMKREKKKYILIGPGRWGSKDQFTGIPVLWSQISNAKVIVEIGLKNYLIEASIGSHFFHNVTSMNVGYFSIPYNSKSKLYLSKLESQKVKNETKFVKHIEFEKPLTILMDGRERVAVIHM